MKRIAVQWHGEGAQWRLGYLDLAENEIPKEGDTIVAFRRTLYVFKVVRDINSGAITIHVRG